MGSTLPVMRPETVHCHPALHTLQAAAAFPCRCDTAQGRDEKTRGTDRTRKEETA